MDSLLKKAFAKETLVASKGYLPKFIDSAVNIDIDRVLPKRYKDLLPDVEGNKKRTLHYTDLSVLYNSERRVPFVSAYNIDGAIKTKGIKRAGSFKKDPRIAPEIQLGEPFYDLRKGNETEFEIGHMAANNEMAWGADAQLKAYQTFHFPNSVPQAENLNTGIWKTLESYIIDEAGTVKDNKKICVFTGPLLAASDPGYIEEPGFKIPLLFYKVIVFKTAKGLYSTGFLMSHEEKMKELNMFAPGLIFEKTLVPGKEETNFDDFKYKKVFQVNMNYLEEQTGLSFSWPGVKKVKVPNVKNQIEKIRKIKGAEDAAKAIGSLEFESLRVNLQPQQQINYKLNIILP